MATLINGISFRVIGGREHSLDSEGAQQLAPYFTQKFLTSIREKPERRAEVGNYMAEESLAHRVCGVVARGDEDGIPRIAVNKHDEELMSVVGGERSHNVNRERVPWASGLNGPCRLLTVAIIATHLTLGTALRNFKANAATGFKIITVAEELP